MGELIDELIDEVDENEEEKESPDKISPLKAIRQYCLDCCCGQRSEVQHCVVTNCSLHPFRFGKNPFTKRGPMSDEQRKAAAERLRKARESEKIKRDTTRE